MSNDFDNELRGAIGSIAPRAVPSGGTATIHQRVQGRRRRRMTASAMGAVLVFGGVFAALVGLPGSTQTTEIAGGPAAVATTAPLSPDPIQEVEEAPAAASITEAAGGFNAEPEATADDYDDGSAQAATLDALATATAEAEAAAAAAQPAAAPTPQATAVPTTEPAEAQAAPAAPLATAVPTPTSVPAVPVPQPSADAAFTTSPGTGQETGSTEARSPGVPDPGVTSLGPGEETGDDATKVAPGGPDTIQTRRVVALVHWDGDGVVPSPLPQWNFIGRPSSCPAFATVRLSQPILTVSAQNSGTSGSVISGSVDVPTAPGCSWTFTLDDQSVWQDIAGGSRTFNGSPPGDSVQLEFDLRRDAKPEPSGASIVVVVDWDASGTGAAVPPTWTTTLESANCFLASPTLLLATQGASSGVAQGTYGNASAACQYVLRLNPQPGWIIVAGPERGVTIDAASLASPPVVVGFTLRPASG